MILQKALVICTILAAWLGARASVVTLCAEDTQQPAPGKTGMNLQTALQQGGSIFFSCGGAATIRFRTTHFVVKDTRIDGGNKITFDGGHNRFGMLQGRNDAALLTFSNLRVINASGPPTRPAPGFVSIGRFTGGFVGGRLRLVELDSVVVEHSWFAIALQAGAIRVIASSFSNNDGSVVSGPRIEALGNSHFSGNRGSPLESYKAATSGPTSLSIDHSDFTSNTEPVRAHDGPVKIRGANFASNAFTGDGGALVLFSSNAVIEESNFTNNSGSEGGAIFIGGNTNSVTLRAVKFVGNIASQSGGAISLERSQVKLDLTMSHMTFQDNRARFGGALSLERDFRNNVSLAGGAVAFIHNQASDSGGAIYAPNASVQLSRGVFVQNVAGNAGGAIAALQQGSRITALANSLIVRNTAPKGSAFWGNSARFINTTIADGNGTAVWPQAVPLGPLLPGAGPTFPIRFSNTIISAGSQAPCASALAVTPYTNEGNNLQFPGTGCGAAISSAFPFLGPYYLPLFISPALHAGNQAICDASPINGKDLYNAHRPLGQSVCAIGAVEGDISHLIRRWTSREGQLTSRR